MVPRRIVSRRSAECFFWVKTCNAILNLVCFFTRVHIFTNSAIFNHLCQTGPILQIRIQCGARFQTPRFKSTMFFIIRVATVKYSAYFRMFRFKCCGNFISSKCCIFGFEKVYQSPKTETRGSFLPVAHSRHPSPRLFHRKHAASKAHPL